MTDCPNRRAKIVCTLGPATDSLERVIELVEAGMNVARLNMSHGDHETHLRRLNNVRQAAQAAGRPIGVFADLQGPKIRLGKFPDGPQDLEVGDRFTITTDDVAGTKERAGTTLQTLTNDVRPGDQILINDGAIELRALEVTDTDVVTEVVIGGRVSDHKGINLPGVAVSVPALSEKDADDLRWALEHGVDMVALSFVRSPATSTTSTRSWTSSACASPSSPRSRSRRLWPPSTRSSARSTRSWSPAATWASSCRWRTSPASRSASSPRPAWWPSPSSWPRRCWSR